MSAKQSKSPSEQFELDSHKIPTQPKELLKGCAKSNLLCAVERCYAQASGLARYYQKQYRRALIVFSVFSVLLVMFFLIYDEGGLIVMLPCYGCVLALYYLLYRSVDKACIHEKYIQYRLLAEALRVQTFLLALGIRENVARQFTWTQKQETQWIIRIIDNFLTEESADRISQDAIRTAWIDDQLSYHKAAGQREKKQHARAGCISRCMIICTALLFAGILLLEFFAPSVPARRILGIPCGIWLKVLWGSISAVTLFISTYYGQQSLERKTTDHEKMAGLFEDAARRYETNPDCRMELFRELAREEIIESGNWMSYSREKRPTFSL